ncbi:MAG: L-aspartate oxidase [Coriobacteriia bacterium]
MASGNTGALGGALPGVPGTSASAAPAPGALPAGLGRRYLVGFDTAGCPSHSSDILIIGSGIAGLTAALTAPAGCSVTLLTKGGLSETNTWYAQGGIAGAVGEADSVELHLADTLVVGQGLCDEEVVAAVVGEAPEALLALAKRGVVFDFAEDGGVALAREGGHSLPRVLHSGDATGAAIQTALTASLRATKGIEVFERRFLVDLLTAAGRCVGALVLNTVTGALEVFWAGATVLAAGGAGQAFRVTTNPSGATGDGLAAAWRAGAEVSDLEFMQFHPTALDHADTPRFLITEAMRGEGAWLLDGSGRRFMPGAHPLAELAPRDVVSREIERVMEAGGRKNVLLDARHLGKDYLRRRFPTIWQTTLEAGYDLSCDLLPVAPAAHYLVGGVKTGIDGQTAVSGLYASGEVAASGLHGANRLASNSLLEGLVFSRRIMRSLKLPAGPAPGRIAALGADTAGDAAAVPARLIELREVMQRNVGVNRSAESLERAALALDALSGALDSDLLDPAYLELENLVTAGALICHAAWIRAESRGCHFRTDFPYRDDEHWRSHIVLQRGAAPRLDPVVREESAENPVPLVATES